MIGYVTTAHRLRDSVEQVFRATRVSIVVMLVQSPRGCLSGAAAADIIQICR